MGNQQHEIRPKADSGDSMKKLILALSLAVTACGFDDVTLEADHYEQMVCAGAWPDYEHRKPDCEARRGIDESKTNY